MNERLKLMLWVELFDSSADASLAATNGDSASGDRSLADNWITNATNVFMNHQPPSRVPAPRSNETSPEPTPDSELWPVRIPHKQMASPLKQNVDEGQANVQNGKPSRPVTPYFMFLQENREKIKADLSLDGEPSTKELVHEGTRRWNTMPDEERHEWRQRYSEDFETYKKELEIWKATSSAERPSYNNVQTLAGQVEDLKLDNEHTPAVEPGVEPAQTEPPRQTATAKSVSYSANPDVFSPLAYQHSDYQMAESAADGARKLADGKSQLLKQLEHANLHQMQPPPLVSPASPIELPMSPIDDADADADLLPEEEGDGDEEDEEEEESEDDESSDEEEYAQPGEDGRGLLTDVPLILGPNEIEVLPMIIMSGIVAPTADNTQGKNNADLTDGVINMYTIRCHLLLAQENGRNLLRELLIFVAAWDLREEELYFKFMVKIMEAILMNGLMPFAYNAFKE